MDVVEDVSIDLLREKQAAALSKKAGLQQSASSTPAATTGSSKPSLAATVSPPPPLLEGLNASKTSGLPPRPPHVAAVTRSAVSVSGALNIYDPVQQKVDTKLLSGLIDFVNKYMIGRDESLRVCLLAIILGQHALMLGPPGTGKSYIGNLLLKLFECDEVTTFQLTFHPNIAMEDIFGPPDLAKLQEGKNERVTKNMLPCAHLTVLDEIFKGSKSCLSPLLNILNERTYKHGTEVIKTKLHTALMASNEVPEDPSQNALFDRILLRVLVDYLPKGEMKQLLKTSLPSPNDDAFPTYSLENIKSIRPAAKRLVQSLTDELCELIDEIAVQVATVDDKVTKDLKKAFTNSQYSVEGGELITDRRRVQMRDLLQVIAFTNGRSEVHMVDLYMCIYCLWKRRSDWELLSPWFLKFLRKKLDLTNHASSKKIVEDHVWLPRSVKTELLKPWSAAEEQEANSLKLKETAESAEQKELEQQQADIDRCNKNLELEKKKSLQAKAKARLTAEENDYRVQTMESEVKEQQDKLQYEKKVAQLVKQKEANRIQLENDMKKKMILSSEAIDRQEKVLQASIELRRFVEKAQDTVENVKEVEKLLAQGARPEQIGGGYGDTTISYCCWHGKVKLLIAAIKGIRDGKVWETRDSMGYFPIHQLIAMNTSKDIDGIASALAQVVSSMNYYNIPLDVKANRGGEEKSAMEYIEKCYTKEKQLRLKQSMQGASFGG